jgi:CRP-like cAMP-binding protein
VAGTASKIINHERGTVMTEVVDLLYIRDEETYSDGEVIFQQGTFGDWVYLIIEGEVKVVRSTPKGDVTVATLREGDFIGELEFLDMGKEPRSANVIAVGDVKLGVLDRDRLRREYESVSADFRLVIRTLVQRTRRITQLATSLAVS